MLKGIVNKIYLAVVVLGLFGIAFGADVKPFVFENVANDSALQQQEFEYMLQYKLYGTEYIQMGRRVVIPDKSGWNGSDGYIRSEEGISIGGPVLTDSTIQLGNECQFTSGPIRAKSLSAGNDNGKSLFGGNICLVDQDVSNSVQTGINRAGGKFSCDDVPEAPVGLAMPVVDWNNIQPDTVYPDIEILDNYAVATIEVPSGESTYDILIDKIHLCKADKFGGDSREGCTLNVRMQDGGRLTRIFVRDMAVGNHTTFNVIYRTDSTDYVLSQKEYRGNLMFYSNEDFRFVNTDYSVIKGTFITTSQIYLKSNIDFAGQFLGNQLVLGDDFKGENFRFVKFDPDTLDFNPELDKNGGLRENDSTVVIPIELSDTATNAVTFTYCFALDNEVTVDDFNTDRTAFPICGVDEITVVIPVGRKTPTDTIKINVKRDDFDEPNDSLTIRIHIAEGAILPNGKFDGELKIKIVDAGNVPTPSFDTTKVYSERENYTGFVDTIRVINKTDSTTLTLDSAYAGRYSLDPVTGELTLLTPVNYEVTQVDTIKVTLHNGSNPAVTRYFPISVIDVNEKPTVADAQFSVAENSSAGTFVGKVDAEDPDVLNPAYGLLTYTLADSTAGAASKFTIDANGNIKVASGATLDYETTPEFYVKAIVTDPQGLADTSLVTIMLSDADENPKIIVDDDDNGKDDTDDDLKCISGCTTDNRGSGPDSILTVRVEENVPTGTVVFEYVVSDEDRDEVTRLVPELRDNNGTGVDSLFVIELKHDTLTDDWKIVVSVKDGSILDFEKVKTSHEVTVVVTDSTSRADSIVRVIQIIDVNELPTLAEQKFELEEHNDKDAVVGTIVAGDTDKDPKYMQNEFSAVSGDTAFFAVSKDGVITAKKEFDYETERTTYEIVVAVTDKNDPTLTVTKTMTIDIKNMPEVPRITDTEFEVKENVPDSTEIGTITSKDPDGENEPRTYQLVEESDFVIVTEDGRILVKDSTKFDYETVTSVTIKVSVTDQDNLSSDTLITIKLVDVNEAPVIPDQTITVKEDAEVGSEVGHIKASDPDTLTPEYSHLTYELVGESEQFIVKEDGTVVLKKELDYETDSVYVIKVRVTDGELADTALVTVKVGNVIEKSEVEITRAETRDSVWLNPDTVYINTTDLCIEWKADGKLMGPDCDLKLEEGKNIIVKEFKGPGKDVPGVDTLIVFVSTQSPIVTVTAVVDDGKKPNIFTIVEKQESADTSFYVNSRKNDIQVKVQDPVSGARDSFVVKLNLDTVNIPAKTFTSTLDGFTSAGLTLNEKPASGVTHTPVNDEKIAVSYTEVVNGQELTVTYYTDKSGNIIESADGVKVMTVAYETEVGGKKVTISYSVDAVTGDVVKTSGGYAKPEGSAIESSSSGKDGDKSSSSGKSEGKDSGDADALENAVVFTVTYDYVDDSGNTITVAYGVDAEGNLVKNEDGNLGYEVSYTYKNKYGNSATQSVFIVLDQVPPKVEILFPAEGDVIYSNFVDVKWTVDIGDGRGAVVQDTLITQGLVKGGNAIVRFYRDKAGNEASDTIRVIMKNAKDVDIAIEQPVTEISKDKVAEFYATSEPEDGQTFAVTIYNSKADKEIETIVGGSFDNKAGSGDEPYPGLEGHLGPTLGIETKVPTINAVGGLATLDDIIGSDGLVPLEGVDAESSAKVTVDEYLRDYCTDEFAENAGSDITKANLYTTKMYVKIWIYTSLGQFVDYYSFTQDLDNPDYVNDAGLLTLYFEMKPDRDGNVRSEEGRLYATGAYVYRTEVEMKSTLRCSVPPFVETSKGFAPEKASNEKGAVRSVKEDLLKSFGYKRPNMK